MQFLETQIQKCCKLCNKPLNIVKFTEEICYSCESCDYLLAINNCPETSIEWFNIEHILNGKLEMVSVTIRNKYSYIDYSYSDCLPISDHNFPLEIKNLEDLNKVIERAIKCKVIK